MSGATSVSVLLSAWRQGDRRALDELIPIVYAELHQLAERHLRRERPDHTFRPTELVGELYLRLADNQPDVLDRVHFFGIAAKMMRQILVDHARRRNAVKRNMGVQPVALDEAALSAGDRPDAMIALDDALSALERIDERKARAIEMHYFGGLTQAEIATVLDVHVNTVARDLSVGQAWIKRRINGEG